MAIETTRMEDLCRICSRSGDFQNFKLSAVSQISNVRIDDMIVYCTQQVVSIGDSLPQQICALCFTSLTSAFLFRKLTYQSESEFRRMIENSLTKHDNVQIVHDYQKTEDPLANSVDPQVTNPEESILSDIEIKEEVLQLENPEVEAIPRVFPADATIPIEHSHKHVVKLHRQSIYTCKDCGYNTRKGYNFKRHQENKKHFAFSQTSTKPFHPPIVSNPPNMNHTRTSTFGGPTAALQEADTVEEVLGEKRQTLKVKATTTEVKTSPIDLEPMDVPATTENNETVP